MAYNKIENYLIHKGIDDVSSSLSFATASIHNNEVRITAAEGDILNLSAQVSAAIPGAVLLVTPTSSTNYNDITTALANAVAGNVVEVGAGVYQESITIPFGVRLHAVHGPSATTLSGSAATGRRITMDTKTSVENFSIILPGDATEAVYYSGTTTCPCTKIENCYFYGQSNSDSYAIRKAGGGLLIVEDCHMISGSAACFASNEGPGTLRIDSSQIEGTVGTVGIGVNAASGSTRCRDFYAGKNSCTTFIKVESGSFNANDIGVSSSQIGLRVSGENAKVNILGLFTNDNSLYDVVVDSGFSSSPRVYVQGDLNRNKIYYDDSYSSVILHYLDDTSGDQAFAVEGELNVGRAEKGHESIFGEGDSYTRGMIVLTTDDTADSTTDGGNLTDVSSTARVLDNNTFTFQGTTAGHAILIGSSLTGSTPTGSTDYLRHWGIKVSNTDEAIEDSALAASSSSFSFEYWNGSAWTRMGTLCNHSSLFYRYANEAFIRATASEHVRFGVDSSTPWEKKVVDGKNLFWSRIKVVASCSQIPTFRQFKLHSSRTEANADGTMTYHGLARYRGTLVAAGNVFGESGGVGTAVYSVGSGGVPTGWNHNSPNSNLNGNGDAIYMQFALPNGIDTSFPIKIRVKYSVDSNPGSTATMICSVLPVEVVGVKQAHPSGSTNISVARTLEDCESMTDKVAYYETQTIDTSVSGYIFEQEFGASGEFDISNYYEGDEILVRVELDDDGVNNADIDIHALKIDGAFWTPGRKL